MTEVTKAALRRQERERQAREATDQTIHQQPGTQDRQTNGDEIAEQPSRTIPHMEPPPPYDAPHVPRESQNTHDHRADDKEHPGCLNVGPGRAEGCLNYSSGRYGPEYKVYGCMNYDNQDGCMNYNSGAQGPLRTDGCMNYDSRDGCMNYRSEDGCMNYESKGGCMNYRSSKSNFPADL